MGLIVTVFSGYVLAVLAAGIVRVAPRRAGWILAVLPALLTVYLFGQLSPVAAGHAPTASFSWSSALNLELGFLLDGLGLLFALLITGIGALVLVYANGYMAHHPLRARFFALILVFMASMLGLVLADNLFLLYVFWELTSVSSWLLIGFEHEQEEARQAAWQALLITSGGGLCLLAGIVLLGQVGGSFTLSQLAHQGAIVRASPVYLALLILTLIGAFTKSAQVPFHIWLPNAMVAPTPVSAYLHSATMVVAGVYLLARLHPVLSGTQAWTFIVATVGGVTMVFAAWLAVMRTDMKEILAYSTISALGMMTLLLGLGNPLAITAMQVFLLGHALYKGALFLVAGAVEHETGTRDVQVLRGLSRVMRYTTAAAMLALLSMVGIPPTLGYYGHDELFRGLLDARTVSVVLLVGAATLASIGYVAAGFRVALRPFWGDFKDRHGHIGEAAPSMWLPPLLMGVLGIGIGLIPGVLAKFLLTPGTSAVVGRSTEVKLDFWHGLGWPVLLATVSIVGGWAVYQYWSVLSSLFQRLQRLERLGPDRAYAGLVAAMNGIARWQTRILQHGYLPGYLAVLFLALVSLVILALALGPHVTLTLQGPAVTVVEVILGIVTLIAAGAAAWLTGRVAPIVSMGLVGYGIGIFFFLFSAPDVAITQFLVETLFVVMVILVLRRLPSFGQLTGWGSNSLRAVVAVAFGAVMCLAIVLSTSRPTEHSIASYYARHSVPEAHGRNIVNVILVDFRAFDTLGEITVLSTAAVGVAILLSFHRRSSPPS